MNGIIVDEFGDITLSGGSLAVAKVDEQIVQFIMLAVPGELKETPTMGMNVADMICGTIDPFFVGKLRTQLKTQHITAKRITVSTTEIYVEL